MDITWSRIPFFGGTGSPQSRDNKGSSGENDGCLEKSYLKAGAVRGAATGTGERQASRQKETLPPDFEAILLSDSYKGGPTVAARKK